MTRSPNIAEIHIKNDVVAFSEVQKLQKMLNQVLKDKGEDWYKYRLLCCFSIVDDIIKDREACINIISTYNNSTLEISDLRTTLDYIDDMFMIRYNELLPNSLSNTTYELLGDVRIKILGLIEKEKKISTLKSVVFCNKTTKKKNKGKTNENTNREINEFEE